MASTIAYSVVFLVILMFPDVQSKHGKNKNGDSSESKGKSKYRYSQFATNYVRWGRNECPADAEILYAGHIATSAASQSGGGSNYLCLTNDQEDIGGNGNRYSELWSVIYKTSELEDQIAPCAVCVVNRGQQVMIPGRSTCYPDWVKEYAGVIMANANKDYKSEFICLDQDHEGLPGEVPVQEQEITCENDEFSLSCESGKTLNIVSANYGRTVSETTGLCPLSPTSISNDDVNCFNTNSEAITRTHCQGRQSCSFDVTNAQFGSDPCVNTYKYLDVLFECVAQSGTLYHVETHCEDDGGVESCHPFAYGGEVPCVVCTKDNTE